MFISKTNRKHDVKNMINKKIKLYNQSKVKGNFFILHVSLPLFIQISVTLAHPQSQQGEEMISSKKQVFICSTFIPFSSIPSIAARNGNRQ
jgi:hypothetical protein